MASAIVFQLLTSASTSFHTRIKTLNLNNNLLRHVLVWKIAQRTKWKTFKDVKYVKNDIKYELVSADSDQCFICTYSLSSDVSLVIPRSHVLWTDAHTEEGEVTSEQSVVFGGESGSRKWEQEGRAATVKLWLHFVSTSASSQPLYYVTAYVTWRPCGEQKASGWGRSRGFKCNAPAFAHFQLKLSWIDRQF